MLKFINAACCLAALLGCKTMASRSSANSASAGGLRSGDKIGVVYVVHGGFAEYTEQSVWDNSVQIFGYDQNSPVYRFAIWDPPVWPLLLKAPEAAKNVAKYTAEYKQLGGTDPFDGIVAQQMAIFKADMDNYAKAHNATIITEQAQWLGGVGQTKLLGYPRFLYHSQIPLASFVTLEYCGEHLFRDAWPNCDAKRYDTDGPFERLAAQGVSKIYMVDLLVGGVRFSKPFDVYTMGKKALAAWASAHDGQAPVPLTWVNDPTDLLQRSFPIKPDNWTHSLGAPTEDPKPPLEPAPNPVASAPELAEINTDGIEPAFAPGVPEAKTGVILLNHPINDNDEFFDPKINDTLIINEGIKATLLKRHPGLKAALVVGAWMGIKELNPATQIVELTRKMHGENLGQAYLYQGPKELPKSPWGYLYWDALKYLRDQGVSHIIIAFPQIVADSVLNLVEVPNQMATMLGTDTWRPSSRAPFKYPAGTKPFTGRWGIWSSTDCGGTACCFTTGGCANGQPYPPPRQTPVNKAMASDDPSLVFDEPPRGELNYQGTWSMWEPANADPRLVHLVTKAVEDAMTGT